VHRENGANNIASLVPIWNKEKGHGRSRALKKIRVDPRQSAEMKFSPALHP